MRDSVEYTIMSAQGLSTAAFTAATTNIITSNAHGLQNGDMVVLTTTNTLPAGLSTGTVYYVRNSATNTFKLAATPEGPEIDITDTGTGTHTWTEHDIGKNIFCRDFRHAIISVYAAASSTLTYKFVGAIGDSCPDFSATRSATNLFEFLGFVDKQNSIANDGDTGITTSGTADDDARQFEINTDGIDWLNVIITAWTAGDITVKVQLYNP